MILGMDISTAILSGLIAILILQLWCMGYGIRERDKQVNYNFSGLERRFGLEIKYLSEKTESLQAKIDDLQGWADRQNERLVDLEYKSKYR